MEWLIELALQYPRRFIAVTTAIVVLTGMFLWWQVVWQNPAHVFADMLAANLATTSVTKLVSAGDGKQTIDETIRQQMGSTNAVDWLVNATQSSSQVTTDRIGMPSTGYLRYTSIKAAGSKPDDFASVLNVWSRNDGSSDTGLGQLFSATVLDVSNAPLPPIGNIPAEQREIILQFDKDTAVFTPNYATVKSKTVAGHRVYEYAVTVRLAAYIRMMQAFAHDLGLKDLDQIDPNQYTGLSPVVVTLDVDTMSHQLVRALDAGSGFSQTYTDWGLLTDITVPHHAISTTELQQRLQALTRS